MQITRFLMERDNMEMSESQSSWQIVYLKLKYTDPTSARS